MFLKPFRVKSHTQLKTSDKKKLREQLSAQIPALCEDDVHSLVPLKEDVSTTKIFCNKGDSVLAYMCGGVPIAFSIESRNGSVMLPSLYLCWQYPHLALAPVFVTHADVLPRMQQGADLMMPGVIYQGQLTQQTFGQFDAGTAAVIVSRGAVVAVGTTALSSTDLYMAGGHGKAVMVAHVVGDHLWSMGSKTMPPYPAQVARSSTAAATAAAAPPSAVDEPQSYSSVLGGTEEPQPDSPALASDQGSFPSLDPSASLSSALQDLDSLDLQDPDHAASPPQVLSIENMDRLLLHCFLKAVQRSKGSLALPLLTSNFYRLHVLPACPDNASLDIKKTSYKKLSKFLKAMEEQGVLQIKEFPKGIENITSVNYDHIDVVSFRYRKSETTVAPVVVDGCVFVPPVMDEVYQVSGDTVDFFRTCGKCKGDVLSRAEVREIVTSYVKRKKLVDQETRLINMEPPLSVAIIAPKEGLVRQLKWDQVFSRVLGRMAPAVRIQREGFPDIIKKGKIEPIEMTVAKRSGNKKVTLVYNVGNYGIVETEFARQLQHMAAASTSVGPAEHKHRGTVQVLVQGNATMHVAKLLLETYNIPKKYIKGLELIPKGKKCKN